MLCSLKSSCTKNTNLNNDLGSQQLFFVVTIQHTKRRLSFKKMNLQRKLSIVKKDKQMQSYEKFTPDAVQSHEKLRSPLYYK